jgi:hypothetical protein
MLDDGIAPSQRPSRGAGVCERSGDGRGSRSRPCELHAHISHLDDPRSLAVAVASTRLVFRELKPATHRRVIEMGERVLGRLEGLPSMASWFAKMRGGGKDLAIQKGVWNAGAWVVGSHGAMGDDRWVERRPEDPSPRPADCRRDEGQEIWRLDTRRATGGLRCYVPFISLG